LSLRGAVVDLGVLLVLSITFPLIPHEPTIISRFAWKSQGDDSNFTKKNDLILNYAGKKQWSFCFLMPNDNEFELPN
jgi:hypothetical protein